MNSKITLITGASKGLGSELALAFAKRGDFVIGVYRNSHFQAEAVKKKIIKSGGTCEFFSCDVARKKEVGKLFQKVKSRWGRLDVLINNAAIIRDQSILKMTPSDWDEVMGVNLKGPFLCLKEAAMLMKNKKHSGSKKIINIASLAGLTGNQGQVNYAASKAALMSLTQTAASEFFSLGIEVTAVIPGILKTSMTAQVQKLKNRPERSLETIAQSIVFISSLKNISGQTFILEDRITKYADLPQSFASSNYGGWNFNGHRHPAG